MRGVSLSDTTTTNVARLSPYGRGYAPTKENKMEDKKPMYRVDFAFFVYADDDDEAANFVIEHLPVDNPSVAWSWMGTTLEDQSNDD